MILLLIVLTFSAVLTFLYLTHSLEGSRFVLLTVPMQCFFCGSFLFMCHVCLCYAVLSVPCSHVIACWERADLLAHFMCVVFSCVFVTCHIVSWSGMVLDCIDFLIFTFLFSVLMIAHKSKDKP